MKRYLLLFVLFFCMCSDKAPKTVGGENPYETYVPGKKMVLIDMGLVEGTINGKKIHAYRVVYNSNLGGVFNDHIYVVEDNNGQINITQPEGKTYKHISVIVGSDTFKLENGKGVLK